MPLRVGLLILVGCLSWATVSAEVRERLGYDYYSVWLGEADSLRTALNNATPIQQAGKRFHGFTRWNVEWRHWWRQESSGICRIERVEVTVTGRIHLPRLQNGDPAQRRRFDNYLAALKQHELGHFAFGRQAAREIDWGIAALTEAPDCEQLEASVHQIGHRVLEYYQDRDDRYDRDTGHGRTQGVVLGPR